VSYQEGLGNKFNAWILASRPKTLPAAVSPVIVGSAFAYKYGEFILTAAIAAVLTALLLQIGANLANDVFDFFKGADITERLGPVRVTQAGLLSSKEVLAGMWISFGIAGILGLYLFLRAGWLVLVIGLLTIIAAIAYTGGPIPLGYYGLGDLTVFIFFGPVAVCGTYFVQALELNIPIMIASIPMGLLITAILVVNNLRDIKTDTAVGKKTLAVMLGVVGTRYEYLICLLLAFSVPFIMLYFGFVSFWVVLVLLALPFAFSLIRSVWMESGPILNKTLAGTGQLVLVFSLLFSVGVVIPL
jgi:1,4-dihydroxy-2-naphthoate octaprenyltransferase